MMVLEGTRDDELWRSSTYSGKASQPNCIVGEALMVHFSFLFRESSSRQGYKAGCYCFAAFSSTPLNKVVLHRSGLDFL